MALSFPILKQCPKCGPDAAGSIRLQQAARRGKLYLQWQCAICGIHWPIETPERRMVKTTTVRKPRRRSA